MAFKVKVGHNYDVEFKRRKLFGKYEIGTEKFKSKIKGIDGNKQEINFEDGHYIKFTDFKKGNILKMKDLGRDKTIKEVKL